MYKLLNSRRILIACTALFLNVSLAFSQVSFGQKSDWHGFDRYDFVMNESTHQLTPITKTEEEGMGVKAPEEGTRRCIVVVPKNAKVGKPWTWRGCYWDHEPQTEIELLKAGYHVAFISPEVDETWDAWFNFLTQEMGLSAKPSFIGMSRGGYNEYAWATAHPYNVTAIYADNPDVSHTSLMNVDKLALNNVPLLHVVGSIDPIQYNTINIERIYKANGGSISVLVKDGMSHHPHSLRNPDIIVNFIKQSTETKGVETPEFIPQRHKRTDFYSEQEIYEFMPSEGVWVSKRGPAFVPKYSKYFFSLGREMSRVSIFVPNKAAPTMPWVYRADMPNGLSAVDLALLEKGFHIVVGPTTTSNGPVIEQWNAFYKYLTDNGFAPRPVLEGCSAATGEMYAWAEQNPDKVACIYGENPIMRSSTAKIPPMDNLKPLADAGVPLINVCGSLDPNLQNQTLEMQKRYNALGGNITVITDEGRGHFPMSPNNVGEVVEIILNNVVEVAEISVELTKK